MKDGNNNFDELKRLLKLKQHEVPPPGYFHHFSGDVVSRIRAGEAGGAQGFLERLNDTAPGLANFLRIFETKPGVIGGFAVSLCLVLLIGIVLPEQSDSASSTGALASTGPASQTGPLLASAGAGLLPAAENSGISASTNPVSSLQPMASMFGQPQNPLFQAASFMPAAR